MAELAGAQQADSRNHDTHAAAAVARGYDFRTPMSAASLDTGAFVHAARNYWRAGVVGGIYFTGGFLLWGGTREALLSSSVFLLGGVAGLWIHRRAGWTSRVPIVALILAHLLVGEAVLIWQKAHLPLSDYSLTGNPADRDFIIYLVSSLIVGTMSMFGGTFGAVLGLAAHYGFVDLPPQFALFDNWWIIGLALTLYVVEFVADKVPWIDTLWDTAHTVVRPLGGAVIAVSTLGEASPWLQGIAALAGGTLAAGGHLTKAGTRAAANMSPEPFTNWALSLAEDVFVVGLGALALWLLKRGVGLRS